MTAADLKETERTRCDPDHHKTKDLNTALHKTKWSTSSFQFAKGEQKFLT